MLPHDYDDIDYAVGEHCSYTTELIESGAFKESGTNVRTALLVLDKDFSGPPPLIPSRSVLRSFRAGVSQPVKPPRPLTIQRPEDVWANL